MPGMPDLILKAPVFGRFAKASRIPGAASSPLLQQMIDRLEAPTTVGNDLDQIAIDMGFYADATQAAHVKRDWLNKDPNQPGFWPTIATEPLMRAGLLRVCKLFQATGKPVEFLWVFADREGGTVWEMTISQLKSALVAIFHTPRVHCFETKMDSQSMWVVRYDDFGALDSRPVKIPASVYPDPPPTAEAVAKSTTKAKKFKKKPKRKPPRTRRGKPAKRKPAKKKRRR